MWTLQDREQGRSSPSGAPTRRSTRSGSVRRHCPIPQAVIMSLIVLGEAATKVMDVEPIVCQCAPAGALAQHAWNAQPHSARLFRYRPGGRVGNGTDGAAFVRTCSRRVGLRTAGSDLFSSPSMAATALQGRDANCWVEWKDAVGRTLDAMKRQVVSAVG